MARIYISSTYNDLKEYREKVYHKLREVQHDAVAMEDYVATDQRPLDKCLADVAKCDLYVGLFAWRYGYIPPKDNPEQKSITDLEYRKAISTDKPRLIFLLEKQAAWPPPSTDQFTGEGNQGKRIVALRQELEQENTVSFFQNPDQLAGLVVSAVYLWEKEQAQQTVIHTDAHQSQPAPSSPVTTPTSSPSDILNSINDNLTYVGNIIHKKYSLEEFKMPQITIKAIEETPLAPQQQPDDEDTKLADSPPVYGTGKHWAVVVGVSDYEETFYSKNASYNRLKTCDKDAEMLYEQLVVRSFHPSRLALFTEHTLTLPNHKAILSRLQSTAGKTQPGDLLLFYYSGFVDEDDKDGYLVTRDSLPQILGISAAPIQSITEIMLHSSASAKVLLFDICHARATTSSKDQKQYIDRFISRIRECAEGVTILTAYKEKQSESQYSVFTSLLKETFARLDASSSNGIVTIQDIRQELMSDGKLSPVSLSVPESTILYRHYHQTSDSYLILAYLYVVKAHRTLEDVQTELKKNSPIYEGTCKSLIKALCQVGNPPQLNAAFLMSDEATLRDRLCKVREYVEQVINSIANVRYICKNSPESTEIEQKHKAILRELADILSETQLIAHQRRNALIPVDVD